MPLVSHLVAFLFAVKRLIKIKLEKVLTLSFGFAILNTSNKAGGIIMNNSVQTTAYSVNAFTSFAFFFFKKRWMMAFKQASFHRDRWRLVDYSILHTSND